MARREPVNAALEKAVIASPDDESAWAVYADWFAERGEPRGELIRLQLLRAREDQNVLAEMRSERFRVVRRTAEQLDRQDREEELITDNWVRWFGDVPSRSLGHSWRFGFVSHAAFGDGNAPHGFSGDAALAPLPAKVRCADVLGLPTLRFLRHVKVTASDELELDGFDHSPLLRRASLYCSSGAPLQRMLLKKRRAPALREVSVDAGGELDAFVRTFGQSALLQQLEDVTLKTLSAAGAAALLEWRDAFQGLGAGLHIVATDECLAQRRSDLRAVFPQAQLSPVPSQRRSSSFRFHGGGPRANATPQRAPANFRELPPIQETRTPGGETIRVGSGVPFEEHACFPRCMGCAGSDTLCIYSSLEMKDGSSENYGFEACEAVCRECGTFTEWECSWETG